jgi:hypothetical protein
LRNQQGELVDTALVDLVVVDAMDTGSKAVWEPQSIRELFLTRARPSEIGLSSIGGWLHPIETTGETGLHVVLGPKGTTRVSAPIAPGLICDVKVVSHELFDDKKPMTITHTPSTIALDGERELVLKPGQQMSVSFNRCGPLVVNLERTLADAAKTGLMIGNATPPTTIPLH